MVLLLLLVAATSFSFAEEENGVQRLCNVSRCLEFDPYNWGTSRDFVNCLRRTASPLLWNPEGPWNSCSATALSTLTLRMFRAVTIADRNTEPRFKDLGIVYLAILCGEAYNHCLERNGNKTVRHECESVAPVSKKKKKRKIVLE